jgi:dynein heavy chain
MTTRKRHNMFAPEQNREKLVVFIDELNMPVKEKYGCQPPIELIRQMIESGGCYDLETKEFKQLVGMVWVSAMLPVKVITPRLLRHYQLIYVPAF